ncbi:hypothetical protein KJA15_02515 [Patescibacteria group bacterium]|nr:hypothetical protein [Patescibacteria group bacterium]
MVNYLSFWEVVDEIRQSSLLQILSAILVFGIGWLIAKIIGGMITRFLDKIRLNQVLKRLGWEEALARVDIRFNAAKFFGEIVKWFFIIIFLMIASEIVGLTGFSGFLEKVIGYFPNIFIAILIFIITLFLVDFSYRIFFVTGKKTKATYSKFLGVGVRRTIWILAILAILYQLQIVPNLILSIFVAILGLIVLSCGLAFGLGGKNLAKKILEELKEKLS